MVMDEVLRPAACEVAARLRKSGRTVDLILEPKKMKQVFKVGITALTHEIPAGCSLKKYYMQPCWHSRLSASEIMAMLLEKHGSCKM